MNDELRDEYTFDYRQAKPNRFAASGITQNDGSTPGVSCVPIDASVVWVLSGRPDPPLESV